MSKQDDYKYARDYSSYASSADKKYVKDYASYTSDYKYA